MDPDKSSLYKDIVDYYEATYPHYRDGWMSRSNLAMHHGYLDAHISDQNDPLANMNRHLAEQAGIMEGEQVLDAGCGVGGSAIWLAKHRRARVAGISLVHSQMLEAHQYAREDRVAGQTAFAVGDYLAAPFAGDSCDIVWAVESVCYAYDLQAFLREAARLLRSGGRLVVADYFQRQEQLSAQDYALLRSWLSGWAMPDLVTPEKFTGLLAESGFSGIKFEDATINVTYSVVNLRRFAESFSDEVEEQPGTPPPWKAANLRGSLAQYDALVKNLWQYGIFLAFKS